ncbi:MAG: penicillin-binding protein 2 [Candidatus Pacebacteria bacterium]|nr:penicillin-binding protein 2 [Candidatus Paceibacterota bacterium]
MFFSKKSFQVKKRKSEIEPQEVFLDALIKKREEALTSFQFEIPLKKRGVFILSFFSLFIFLAIFAQLINLQIVSFEKFQVLAQKNQFFYQKIRSQRGIIYDRNFAPLVFNKPRFDLICKVKPLKENENVFQNLATMLNLKEEIYKEIQENKEDRITLKENLNYQEIIRFEGLSDQFPACHLEKKDRREYPQEFIFSHIIGYWREGGTNDGLEKFYDDILRFRPGKIAIERDAKGRIISERVEEAPKPGKSLVLWIDKDLQETLYYALEKKLKELGLKKAAAVAMDPNTGGILALVSFPSYDNNLFAQGLTEKEWQKIQKDKTYPLLNRVIAGKYPTGSTIKPLIAAAALKEGKIKEHTTINCKGQIVIENPYFKDKPFIYRDWKVHGIVDVKKAIAESSNVFFYIVGGGYKNFKGLGVDLINKYLELFGWGEKLGIDLPGEKAGFIPTKEWKKEKFKPPLNIWYLGDTYNLSIGQGYLKVTPLQVVASFSAIANGGRLLKPRIAKAIVDEKKNIIKEFEPEVIRENFVEDKYLKIVREGMREAVVYGSATILNDLPVEVAAKTGTAEIGKKDKYHNWVTVFAPYKNPKIVLTIIVEEVRGIRLAALPVAKEVLLHFFQRGTAPGI